MEPNQPQASQGRLKSFVQRWIITTVAVLVAAQIVPGIHYDSGASLIAASLLLGVLNAFVRPLMMLLSLPLIIFTLGLFILIINALLLSFVGWLLDGFDVRTFWAAFWGGIIISLVSFTANVLFGTGGRKVVFRGNVRVNRNPKRDPDEPPHGSGPVIDV